MRYFCLLALAIVAAAGLPARTLAAPRLTNIVYVDGLVKIELTEPAAFQTTAWKTAKRFIVDVNASGINLQLRELPVYSSALRTVRWNQWKADSIRIVLDLNTTRAPVMQTRSPAATILLRVAPPAAAPVARPPATDVSKIEDNTPTPPEARGRIKDIRVDRDESGRPQRVVVLTDRELSVKPDWWGNYLTLDFPDAAGSSERIMVLNDPQLLRVRTGTFKSHGRVVLDLTRRVDYRVSPLEDTPGYSVDLALTAETTPPPVPPPPVVEATGPVDWSTLRGRLVVLDPGHGAHDTGARSAWVTEKVANLDIAQRMKTVLESYGARVIMTRDNDTFIPLRERPAVAMQNNADAFVSIHCNSSVRPTSRGTEVFYRRSNEPSRRLATHLYNEHRRQTGLPGRRVKPDSGAPQGGLAVLKRTTVPCALVEVAFVNWPEEGKKLREPAWRQTVAEGLVKGLARFFMEGQG